MDELEIKDRTTVPEETPGRVYGYGSYPLLGLRAMIGGLFAGLAAIVPGVSGGTMLLAAGVYPFFLESIYDLTQRRWNRRAFVVLANVLVWDALAILFMARPVRALLLDYPHMMYSLFAGLAVGGIPVVYGMARPLSKRVVVSAVLAFWVVVAFASLKVWAGRPIHEHVGPVWYFLGGLIAGTALVLPGISGAYLLMIMGLFGALVDSVDGLHVAFHEGRLASQLGPAASVLFPMGAGAMLGVLGLSRIFHRLLIRDPRATVGALVGLLVGALIELWPFQKAVAPNVGDIVGGRLMTAQLIAEMPPERYPIRYYTPDSREIFVASLIFVCGFALTALVARFGSKNESGLDLAARSQA